RDSPIRAGLLQQKEGAARVECPILFGFGKFGLAPSNSSAAWTLQEYIAKSPLAHDVEPVHHELNRPVGLPFEDWPGGVQQFFAKPRALRWLSDALC
ncbi:MAG TPA: hypothetical protein VNR65_13255, partial [Geobacterales bacterium]|nr:hypothetical protein [Geobacterales bacterium]